MNKVPEGGTRGQAAGQENPVPHLLPQHLVDLRKSGLSDETIRAAKIKSIVTEAEAHKVLKWKGGEGSLLPAMAIPFLDRERKLTDFARLKPDKPRHDK